MKIVTLRGRERDPDVHGLLAMAQIHRPVNDAQLRGPSIAAQYASTTALHLWGAEGENTLMGIVGVEPQGATLVLHDLAVLPQYRQNGIGRRLIAFLVDAYPNKAIVGATLTEAGGFYSRLGFEVSPDGLMPSGEPRLRFELSYRPAGSN